MPYFYLFTIGALFGSSAMLFKILSTSISGVSIVFLRMLIGSIFLMIVCVIKKKPIIQKEFLPQAIFLGVFNFILPLVFFAFGSQILEGSIVSILNGMFPVFTLVLSYILLIQPFAWLPTFGVVVSIVGVFVLTKRGDIHLDTMTLYASIGIIIATISYAISTIFIKMRCTNIPTLTNVTASMLMSTIFLFPSFLYENNYTPFMDWQFVLSILYFGIFPSGIAYLLLFHLVEIKNASFASNGSFLIPIFGSIYGLIFMNEIFTTQKWIGGGLILFGMALVLNLHKSIKFSR